MSAETSFTLTRLLAWLDADPVRAGERYVQFHQELTAYLARYGAHTVAEALADEALDRVDKRLATSLLNEHSNSTDLSDFPGLCCLLSDEGANQSPGPGRRIWELLPDSERDLIAAIACAGNFERSQRSRLSRALNELLRRRDFYRAEDFDLTALRRESRPLLEKIEADLARGLAHLQQDEIERFNRCLIDASYPGIIKINLADAPEKDKLPRCKHFARIVLLEYFKKLTDEFEPLAPEPGAPAMEKPIRDPMAKDPLTPIIEAEGSQERRRKLACQEECKRKLSPRDRVVLDKYFTGIEILSRDDEPLPDREIKDIRKALSEELGVAPKTIRTIARRSKKIVFKCIERCMKRQEKTLKRSGALSS